MGYYVISILNLGYRYEIKTVVSGLWFWKTLEAHCHASARFFKEGAKAPFSFCIGGPLENKGQRGHIFVNRVLVNTNTNCEHESFSKKEHRIYIATLDYLTIYQSRTITSIVLEFYIVICLISIEYFSHDFNITL